MFGLCQVFISHENRGASVMLRKSINGVDFILKPSFKLVLRVKLGESSKVMEYLVAVFLIACLTAGVHCGGDSCT